jgi:hypothetical protein
VWVDLCGKKIPISSVKFNVFRKKKKKKKKIKNLLNCKVYNLDKVRAPPPRGSERKH